MDKERIEDDIELLNTALLEQDARITELEDKLDKLSNLKAQVTRHSRRLLALERYIELTPEARVELLKDTGINRRPDGQPH